jgi:hypothetical protein
MPLAQDASCATQSVSLGDSVRTFATGDRVAEAKFGAGTVTSANEYHTVIDFDEHGVRTFSTPIVRLERSSTAAPPKAVKTARRKKA